MATGVKVELIGLEQVIGNARIKVGEIEKALGRELYIEGNRLKTESLEETPIRFGALRGSAFVSLPEEEGGETVVKVGFGGPAAPYAKIVHDNPEAYHKPPTKYRYLIDPFNRRLKGFAGRIAAGVKASFK